MDANSSPVATGTPASARAARGFGRAMLSEWTLDPEAVYLNHGTVGVCPRRVLAAQQAIRDEIERQPARFMIRELADVGAGESRGYPRMRAAADAVAPFVGVRGADFAFVDNITAGVNAVLRSLTFAAGDEILITDLGYGAVKNAADYVASRTGAVVRTVELPGPPFDPARVTEAISGALTAKTRLLVIDHITSSSALILPVAAVAARARAAGIPVLVDGAHAPGAIPLDIASLGVDWYSANLHKWAMAPRSSGFLWVAPGSNREIHPTVISWGYGKGLAAEFDLPGTRDPSPWLAAPAGIDFLKGLGLEAVYDHNHRYVMNAARALCERWGIVMPAPESMIGTMIALPLPESFGTTQEDARRLKTALLDEDGIEVAMPCFKGRVWLRLCGQVYNDVSDLDRLIRAIEARVKR